MLQGGTEAGRLGLGEGRGVKVGGDVDLTGPNVQGSSRVRDAARFDSGDQKAIVPTASLKLYPEIIPSGRSTGPVPESTPVQMLDEHACTKKFCLADWLPL